MKKDIPNLFSVNEVELIYRNRVPLDDRIKVTSSGTAYDILLTAWDMNKIELLEHCYLMLLDRNSAVLGLSHMATGGVHGCIIDPKIVFATALKAKASAIMLAHNHPSGNLLPSRSDIDMTTKISEGGRLLDIALLDHLIITPQSYYSFADNGVMP